jgi:hypothetical protein
MKAAGKQAAGRTTPTPLLAIMHYGLDGIPPIATDIIRLSPFLEAECPSG